MIFSCEQNEKRRIQGSCNFKRFGGNFRALEFFNRLYVSDPERIIASLDSIGEFDKSIEADIAEIREFMGKDLYFDDLMSLLGDQEKRIISLLI